MTPPPRRRRPTIAELVGAVPAKHAASTAAWRGLRAFVLVAYGAWPLPLLVVLVLLPWPAGTLVFLTGVAALAAAAITGALPALWHHERARWRGAVVRLRWGYVMTAVGLGEFSILPKLRAVRIRQHGLALTVRIAAGQRVDDWRATCPALVHAWRAETVEVVDHAPGFVVLAVALRDPLEESRPWPG